MNLADILKQYDYKDLEKEMWGTEDELKEENLIGKQHGNGKKARIGDTTYTSISEASWHTGFKTDTIVRNANKPWSFLGLKIRL